MGADIGVCHDATAELARQLGVTTKPFGITKPLARPPLSSRQNVLVITDRDTAERAAERADPAFVLFDRLATRLGRWLDQQA